MNPEIAQYFTAEKNETKFQSQVDSLNGKEAFFMSQGRAEFQLQKHLLFNTDISYRLSNNCPIPLSMSMELQPRSPYKRIFDKLLLRAVQAGLPVNKYYYKLYIILKLNVMIIILITIRFSNQIVI